MGVIPNPKMAFIFPISCILALIFPIFMKYFPKCSGKGSFPKSQIKSLWQYKYIGSIPSIVYRFFSEKIYFLHQIILYTLYYYFIHVRSSDYRFAVFTQACFPGIFDGGTMNL